MNKGQRARKTLSPKVTAATLAGALATLIWVPISTYVLTGFDPEAMAALSGATGTVLTFILGFFIPDPLREE